MLFFAVIFGGLIAWFLLEEYAHKRWKSIVPSFKKAHWGRKLTMGFLVVTQGLEFVVGTVAILWPLFNSSDTYFRWFPFFAYGYQSATITPVPFYLIAIIRVLLLLRFLSGQKVSGFILIAFFTMSSVIIQKKAFFIRLLLNYIPYDFANFKLYESGSFSVGFNWFIVLLVLACSRYMLYLFRDNVTSSVQITE